MTRACPLEPQASPSEGLRHIGRSAEIHVAAANGDAQEAPLSVPQELPLAATKHRLSIRQRAIFLGLLVAVTSGAFYYHVHQLGREFTDDAQLDADIVAVPARVNAPVRHIAFVDNQRVSAGDLLVELDDELAIAKVVQAEATLAAEKSAAMAAEADAAVSVRAAKSNQEVSEAQLAGAKVSVDSARDLVREAEAGRDAVRAEARRIEADLLRTKKLAVAGTASAAELEHAEADHRRIAFTVDQAEAHVSNIRSSVSQATAREVEAAAKLRGNHVGVLVDQALSKAQAARARVGVAESALSLARLELGYTKIHAPADGIVSKRSVTVGQMLGVGQPVVQLIATQRLWVTANFKETQLGNMRAGQLVRLKFDAAPGVDYSGFIADFSGATGARFALLPPDNATGNFTKVVQRVPVRIRLNGATLPSNLVPGLSVEATVLTR